MKRRLMDLIRCPACRGRLELEVFRETTEAVAVPVPVPACRTLCYAARARVDDDTAPAVDCQACYAKTIVEGVLFCPSCTLAYPIVDGVPRLVRNACDEYADFFATHSAVVNRLRGHDPTVRALESPDGRVFHARSNRSFSLQWQMHGADDRTWFKSDLDQRRAEFLDSLDVQSADLAGRLVLDAGCGNGKLTSAVATYGAEVVGMDLSGSVGRANAQRESIAGVRAPFVHYVQGNVMEPPFAQAAFDHLHSSGVLHHTPSTRRAFSQLLTVARPGARVYVQLYRKREAWVGIPNRLIRSVTSRMPVDLLYRACYAAVPAHTALVRVVARLRGEKTALHLATRRERAVSMFDNYSPRYQERFKPAQVRGMFEAAGLRDVKDVTFANEQRHMVAFVGRRPECS